MIQQAAHVLHCVEIDTTTQECIQQVWVPATSFFRDLTAAEVTALLTPAVLFLAVCWAWKQAGRTIRD